MAGYDANILPMTQARFSPGKATLLPENRCQTPVFGQHTPWRGARSGRKKGGQGRPLRFAGTHPPQALTGAPSAAAAAATEESVGTTAFWFGSISGIRLGASTVSSCTGKALVKS